MSESQREGRKSTWKHSLLCVLIAALGIAGYTRLDEDLRDDSDLLVERRIRPDEENAVSLMLPVDVSDEFQYMGFENWDETLATKMLALDEDYFKRVEEMQRRPELQFLIRFVRPYSADEIHEALRQIGASFHLRSLLALSSRRLDAAIQYSRDSIRFGRRIQRGRGRTIYFHFGSVMIINSLEVFRAIADSSGTRTGTIRSALTFLRQTSTPSLEEMLEAIRVDYEHVKAEMHFFKLAPSDELPDFDGDGGMSRGDGGRSRVEAYLARWFYLPGETINKYAKHTRGIIGQLNRGEIDYSTGAEYAESTASFFNYLGQKILRTFPVFMVRSGELEWRMTSLYLAVRAYELETGKLPDALEDLVPAFLPSVPEDPHDKKPLRYSKVKRRIWSIGRAGLDKGGADVADNSSCLNYLSHYNPTLHLRFDRDPFAKSSDADGEDDD